MNQREPSRQLRKVSITVQGLSDLTPLTWLQYHHAIVVYHRNRLASLPVGQILSYANLHFNQITTFEQVEMLPLSHRQFEILASKVLGIALNDHRKSMISMKEAKKTGGLFKDQFDTTQTPETLSLLMSASADNSLVVPRAGTPVASNSTSPDVPLLPGSDNSLNSTSQAPPGNAGGGDKNFQDIAVVDASSIENLDKKSVDAPDSSLLEDQNRVLDEGSDLDDDEDISMPPPTKLDNDVDGQNDGPSPPLSPPPTRVHVLDASLNRIRRLAFSSITIWNVRSILFMNLSGNLLVSLDGIECCKNLVVLDSSDNILTHMHPLRGCILLKRLRINGNHLVSVSLDGGDPSSDETFPSHLPAPAPYPALDYLDINNNHLDSVNGLKGLKNFGQSLVHFEMRNCNLSTSAFAELDGSALLESLHADNNRIDSLKPLLPILKKMPKLRHLSLLGNPVAGRGSSSTSTLGKSAGDFSTVEKKHAGGDEHSVGNTKSTLGVDILNSFGLNYNAPSRSVQAGGLASPDTLVGEGKESVGKLAGSESDQQVSMYAITILDNVPRLKTFDHLAVSSALYSDLARLKTQIIGEDMLYEISNKYSREITKTMRVHDNLVAKHRVDAELVELAVKSKIARLEQEMEEVMHFGREKLESLRPKYAIDQHFNTDSNPQEVLESISTMREKVATPFSNL